MAKYNKKTNNPRMGAPRKEIDFNMFENMCAIQGTEEEIASVFGIDVDTLNARVKEHYNCTFSEIYKKHSGKGKMSLRRYQFRMAEKNPGMAIWLGKQMLGQKDQHEPFESRSELIVHNADEIQQKLMEEAIKAREHKKQLEIEANNNGEN